MRLLIIGPQGAGKGTQAGLLAQAYGIPHVSTGDLFRVNITGGTELGRKVQEYLNSGALVPDEVTQDMVVDRIEQQDAQAGFLLDGFPRNPAQATWLEQLLKDRGSPIDVVLLLQAPDEVLIGRMMARGRDDDTEEAIAKRLAIYHSETEPLVEFYADRLVAVDGVGEIEQVQQRIRSAIDAKLAG